MFLFSWILRGKEDVCRTTRKISVINRWVLDHWFRLGTVHNELTTRRY